MCSRRIVGLLLVILLATSVAFGQGVMGRIVGSVQDSTGAVVVGAKLEVVDQGTGATRTATSGADGKFVFLALQNGMYKLTVTMQGFQKAVYPDIKVDLGRTAEITAQLQVGAVNSEVVVEAAAEVIQTQTTAIEGGVQGRQLRALPLANRDVLDFVLLMPGAQQAGGTRDATFEGLGKNALNITMDGMNIQDLAWKSSSTGGYFTSIRPKQDAVEEIQVTTGVTTADNSGMGAVQIKFATRRGTNDWHGGAFEFFRDTGLDANTFFHNRNTTPVPRTVVHMNQYGASIGGPLIKNKLFVFNNFEDFRLPSFDARSSSLYKTTALQGNFPYGSGLSANVFTIAAAYNAANPTATPLPTTLDPTVNAMMQQIQGLRTSPLWGAQIAAGGASSTTDTISWNAPGGQRRWFNTTRIDYDINDKVRWNTVGQWNHFASYPDFLNNAGVPFPIAGYNYIAGGQNGARFSLVTALNWTVTPRLNYEFRIGQTNSTTHFADGRTIKTAFPNNYCISMQVPTLMSSPGATGCLGSPSQRNAPDLMMSHNFGYISGKHTFSFGGQLDIVTYWNQSYSQRGIPTITLGYNSTYDTAVSAAFSAAAMPGSNATERSNAAALWANLVGRVSGVSGGINFSAQTRNYTPNVPYAERGIQKELGVYAQDSFRATKTLTLNYGVRWQRSGAVNDRVNITVLPGVNGAWGVSGVGNLFQPGNMPGIVPQYHVQGSNWYDAPQMFLPNFGLAWSPNYDNKLWKAIFGGSGKTVFRGGYSLGSTREGIGMFADGVGNGPQYSQSTQLRIGTEFLNASGTGAAQNPLMLTDYNTTTQTWPMSYYKFPPSFTFPMPVNLYQFTGTSLYQPQNIRFPYVQSWSFGMQRELTSNMVLEARYQGNHGTRLLRFQNINEVNIFENGLLNEFRLAQQNQQICLTHYTDCFAAQASKLGGAYAIPYNTKSGSTTSTQTPLYWGNLGLPGQAPLPILETAITGLYNATNPFPALTGSTPTAGQANSYYANSSYIDYIKAGRVGTLAGQLAGGNSTLFCNLVGTGVQGCIDQKGKTAMGLYPANMFQANPEVANAGSYLFINGADSFYDAFMVEMRRRMTKGLMIQGNYTFSKSISNMQAESDYAQSSFTTMRNTRLDRGLSPFDITHTARVFWTWELPFGPGRHFAFANKVMSKVVEGWEFSGIAALQSGRVFRLSSGRATFNGNESGVVLNGVTPQQLQKLFSINKNMGTYPSCGLNSQIVYFFPANMVDSNCSAYHFDPTAQVKPVLGADGVNYIPLVTYNTDGMIQIPTTPGQFGQFVYLHGPHFIKPDLTLAKQTKINERVNARFEARFFNAFNITNFLVGGLTSVGTGTNQGITGTSFGQTGSYYNDVSQNQDQGPRMIELVLRINF